MESDVKIQREHKMTREDTWTKWYRTYIMLQHTQRAMDIKIKKIRDQDGRSRGEGPRNKTGSEQSRGIFHWLLSWRLLDGLYAWLLIFLFSVYSPNHAHTQLAFSRAPLSFNERRHPCYCVPRRVSTIVSELANWIGGDPQGPTWSLQGKSLVCPQIVPWLTCCTAWHSAGTW